MATSSKYGVLCFMFYVLSETFPDSEIKNDDKRLNIEGDDLIIADHLGIKKRTRGMNVL